VGARLAVDGLALDEDHRDVIPADRVVDLLGRPSGPLLGEVGDVLRLELGRVVYVVPEQAQERHDQRLLGGFLAADMRLAPPDLLDETL
jgi:hypothetical protein